MYKSYWGMEFNPFEKGLSEKNFFQSHDFSQAMSRLEHLKNMKGIGLFTGLSGIGKTYTLRCFTNSLNSNLYKVIYLTLSTVTVLEFYKSLAYGLGVEIYSKKIDLFKAIQERIISLSKDKKVTPVIIIDEAQYLKTEVLNDLKLLLNFDMDSRNYAVLILCGQPLLNNILSKQIHEALKQRIVINYNYEGICKEEVIEYISSRLKLCGVFNEIFNANALEAINSCCNGSTRLLNSLIEKCLIIGYQKSLKVIDTETVMLAQNEINLI
ncbi:ExeA family protein [Clostridium sp. DJ247]|uniref:ExeA family protein n=1 Tax=Clostridium sp. DJ247 TaxID=2726188 RepID=UPI00162607A3|nr:AAA family ATPase [Clostridium sp. DJ247]MBC2582937.1 AAA family ATPase [Clostridium sp. DJ247]